MTPFPGSGSPDEDELRQQAYQRLADAAARVGLSLDRLGRMLGEVAENETETRRFLAERVYGVPDEHLDEYLRVRLADLPPADGADE